jgi:hypothetical protein
MRALFSKIDGASHLPEVSKNKYINNIFTYFIRTEAFEKETMTVDTEQR